MPLDNKAIETLSVNAVKDSIVTSEFLDQFIVDNDKEPSWDGFVYIYGDKSKKKNNLKGRMPVQVKGTECDDHSKKIISFSMTTVDLRNYLYDGGCILFVVYIGNCGVTKKIYYLELTPVKLRQLLNEAKGQDNKTVRLKEFPSDNNKKATIFLNCLQNCQKQASFKEGKLLTLDELQKQGILENIVIPFEGVGINDPQRALVNNEIYIYAKIKGSSIPQPIDMVPEGVYTNQVCNAKITIKGKLFYRKYNVIKNASETTVCLGSSFKISFSEQKQSCKITYKNSDKIRVLVKDLDFMLSYLKNGYFKLNNVRFPFDYEGMNSTNFDVEKEKKHLKYAKDIVRVLDMLGCSDDIDINDMKDEDWRNVNRLITALIEKKPVKGLKEGLPSVCSIKVGKLKFVVYLKKCKNADKGTYEILDFFKVHLSVAFDNGEGKMLPISQFCILHKDDFLTLDNINFDVLLPSFQKTAHYSQTFNKANGFLLELLSAYDKAVGIRKEKLLKVCDDFSKWISEADDEEFDYQIRTLNRLQIIKRSRDLNIDEIATLYQMVECKDTREDCVVGAYLLLGQQQAATIHFLRLTKDEQNNFKEYPIYRFWKTEEKNNG